MKFFATFALAFLTTIAAFGQNTLRESNPVALPFTGYVINNNGDTIRGKISAEKLLAYMGDENMLLEEISFNDYGTTKQVYKAKNVKGFAQKRPFPLRNFEGFASIDPEFAHFESMPHPEKAGQFVFAERLMGGSIQVFSAPKMIVEGESGDFKVLEDNKRYFVIKNDGKVLLMDEFNYETHFTELFGDCEEMAEFLERHPQMWEFASFHLLVELYNDHFNCK